jgi:outer membrane protein assembly factor BamB
LNIPAEPAGVAVPGRTLGATALYDAGNGTLATVPGDTSSGNGLRAFALQGAQSGCGPSTATHDCPLWATPLDGTDAWQPVLGNNGATLYVGTDAGTVYAVDAATGSVQWSAAVGSAVTNSLALAGDMLFVPTASGDFIALAADGCGAATCAPLWSGATGDAVDQQPAVANGVVYTASADGSLHAFSTNGCGAATCPALWSDATGEQISDGPIVSAGWLYVTFHADHTASTQPGGVLGYTVP